jgi:putative ABC transport system substrate-binding protein
VIALLVNPASATAERIINDVHQAARSKSIQLAVVRAAAEDEFETAFASLVRQCAGALLVGSDAFFNSRREQLVALASRYAVPAIYEWRDFTEVGGLISYGTLRSAAFRQLGAYAGMILNDAKPADLPVVQTTRFELVIKTAKRSASLCRRRCSPAPTR